MLQQSISTVPAERRKKKLCRYGKIEIANTHRFSAPTGGFQISPYMQELMTYAGQLQCYSHCNEVLQQFLSIEVSVMQVYRVTDCYGSLLEQEKEAVPAPAAKAVELRKGESVYALTDGSMLLSREEGWQEVKLGCLFKESDCMQVSTQRGWIRHSTYEGYIGNKENFTRRFEQKVDAYQHLGERLIFITDGALWLKNWITDAYPKATQILDWYDAVEHLGAFAAECFDDPAVKHSWIEEQKALLYESKTQQVMHNIAALPQEKESIEASKNKLPGYYGSNTERHGL